MSPGLAVVVVTNAGRPVAKLVRYEAAREPRRPGRLKGQIVIRDDFDDPMPEFEKLFSEGQDRA